MVIPDSQGTEKAVRHETLAREYRRLAEMIRERESSDGAAGELLYGAAKQCINAVANLQGLNPVSTMSKGRFVDNLAGGETPPNLRPNWLSAIRLHVHSDQVNLTPEDFEEAWQVTQTFIDRMLHIYAVSS